MYDGCWGSLWGWVSMYCWDNNVLGNREVMKVLNTDWVGGGLGLVWCVLGLRCDGWGRDDFH